MRDFWEDSGGKTTWTLFLEFMGEFAAMKRFFLSILSMVRHHLTDDWAFFNAEPDKESSVQEENKITQTCSHFHRIVYLPEYQEWTKTGHIAKFNEVKRCLNLNKSE